MEHVLMDKVAHLIIGRTLKYIKKDPAKNMMKIIRIAKRLMGKTFPESAYRGMVSMATDSDNNWHKFAMKLLDETDHEQIEKMLVAFGLHGAIYGTKTVRANREKYACNIPFILLLDPTSACNLRCKGCWSAEYNHHLNLTLEQMQSIVAQAKALGTRIFMFTGGEPLVRKKDILVLAKENPECVFLAYTNGTLVDEAFVKEMKRCGNLLLALSVEGDEAANDARRGKGIYQKSREAMRLLKKHKCLFGVSVCYTSQNLDAVTDDAFFDDMIDLAGRNNDKRDKHQLHPDHRRYGVEEARARHFPKQPGREIPDRKNQIDRKQIGRFIGDGIIRIPGSGCGVDIEVPGFSLQQQVPEVISLPCRDQNIAVCMQRKNDAVCKDNRRPKRLGNDNLPVRGCPHCKRTAFAVTRVTQHQRYLL